MCVCVCVCACKRDEDGCNCVRKLEMHPVASLVLSTEAWTTTFPISNTHTHLHTITYTPHTPTHNHLHSQHTHTHIHHTPTHTHAYTHTHARTNMMILFSSLQCVYFTLSLSLFSTLITDISEILFFSCRIETPFFCST